MQTIKCLILVLAIIYPFHQQSSQSCKNTLENETTNWGHRVEIFEEKNILKKLNGIIISSDNKPIDNVLIEVFDNPEIILNQKLTIQERVKLQKRIALCKTQSDGRFYFKNIINGKYELRCSKNEFDTVSIIVTINSKNLKSKRKVMTIQMMVSQ